jgi:PEGA domain
MVCRGLLVAAILVAITSRAAPVRGEPAEVEALIAKGNELRRAGTPGPALPYFQKAYELARTPRTTGQLGLAELAAGYPVEAEVHLVTALESPNDPGIVKYRQMLRDALTMARLQIGELAIEGRPQGAEVFVNGRAVGTLPLATPLKLAARNTEVVVRAAGHAERRELIPIAGGQRHTLKVSLEKLEAPAEQPPVVTPLPAPSAPATIASAPPSPLVAQDHPADATESGAGGLRTAAWVTGGAALVAGGVGLGFHLAARANQDDSEAWEAYRRWSIVGYVSGAALAVTSGVLFYTSRPSTAARASSGLQAGIQCGPTPTGISCHGAF